MARSTASFLSSSTRPPPWHSCLPSAKSMAGTILGHPPPSRRCSILAVAPASVDRDGHDRPGPMTSHPPQPASDWPASGQAFPPPADARSADGRPADGQPANGQPAGPPMEAVPPDAPRLSALPDREIAQGPVAADSWPGTAADDWQHPAAGGWPGTAADDWQYAAAADSWPDAAGTRAQPEPELHWPGQADAPADPGDWQQEGPAAGYLIPADAELAAHERWATLSYLGVPFLGFLIPLAIYVLKRRRSSFIRYQSAQALNLSLTGLLYTFCVLIIGTTLSLDSVTVAVLFGAPLAAALWVVTLGYVVLAAAAASRGEYYQIPAWICATVAR